MKNVVITLMLLFSIGMISCLKNSGSVSDDLFWEVPLNSKNAVINNTVDDIEFKFCLLNENGLPATQFKHGENFHFYFAMINHRIDKPRIYEFVEALRGNGFCQVISQEQDTIGFPFSDDGLCILRLDYYPFYGENNKYEVTVPWSDQREYWGSFQCNFTSLHQPALPKGEYYTEFSHKFVYVDQNRSHFYVGPITFKINFKIE